MVIPHDRLRAAIDDAATQSLPDGPLLYLMLDLARATDGPKRWSLALREFERPAND